MSRPSRYSPEQRAKAVRMVAEATPNYPSRWAAIKSVGDKIDLMSIRPLNIRNSACPVGSAWHGTG